MSSNKEYNYKDCFNVQITIPSNYTHYDNDNIIGNYLKGKLFNWFVDVYVPKYMNLDMKLCKYLNKKYDASIVMKKYYKTYPNEAFYSTGYISMFLNFMINGYVFKTNPEMNIKGTSIQTDPVDEEYKEIVAELQKLQ